MGMEKIFNTDKRIRLGIWGLGRGSSFIKAARELNIDVVAGCDFNGEIRERFHNECPDAMVTADENEFLSYDMDAVLVATFFTAHADHAMKALEAGYHVMSEVTSFFTPADGVRLVEAVEKSGKIYNLLENYPFTKENMYLAKLWKDGFFGEFQYGRIFRRLNRGIPFIPGDPGWTSIITARILSVRLCKSPDCVRNGSQLCRKKLHCPDIFPAAVWQNRVRL